MSSETKEALNSARELHLQGQFDRAEPLYQQILDADPKNGEAWHLLGVLNLQTGQGSAAEKYLSTAVSLVPSEAKYHNNLSSAQKLCGKLNDAENSLRQAIIIDPEFADAHVNLSSLLLEQERYEEAVESIHAALKLYPNVGELHLSLAHALFHAEKIDAAALAARKAIELKPELGAAYNVLGGVHSRRGQLQEAITAYKQTLAADNGNIPAYINLGLIYRTLRESKQAEDSYRKALSLDPKNVEVLVGLGGVLIEEGRQEEALSLLRQALKLDPENGDAVHMVAALSGTTTDTAPEGYVKNLFNHYAPNFEQDLSERLQYNIPTEMRQVVDQYFTNIEPDKTPAFSNLLDLGSGTGMVGDAFRNCADVMIGVDLAPRMIEAARAKGIYTELHEAELLEYLASSDAAKHIFDIVLAADVFIYVGKLDALFTAIGPCLSPEALLVFSVENSDSEEYVLRPSGRYAQSRAYIEKLADTHGFEIAVAEPANIRKHGNEFMPGTIYVLKFKLRH